MKRKISNFLEVSDIHRLCSDVHRLCPKHEPFWPKSDDQPTLTLNIALTNVPNPAIFGTINLRSLKNK